MPVEKFYVVKVKTIYELFFSEIISRACPSRKKAAGRSRLSLQSFLQRGGKKGFPFYPSRRINSK
jgi:hypothetical protein